MSITKLLKEELQQLRDIQSKDNELTFELGRIEVKKVFLERDRQKIEGQYQTHLSLQNSVGKELQEKYGDGNIDLEKGEFIKLK